MGQTSMRSPFLNSSSDCRLSVVAQPCDDFIGSLVTPQQLLCRRAAVDRSRYLQGFRIGSDDSRERAAILNTKSTIFNANFVIILM